MTAEKRTRRKYTEDYKRDTVSLVSDQDYKAARSLGINDNQLRPTDYEKRLSITNQGKVQYELKTAYDGGMNHVIFDPVDFIANSRASNTRPVQASM